MTTIKPKLTPTMKSMLTKIADGKSPTDGLIGRSEHGGASSTYSALFRHKLVANDGKITPAGLEAIGRTPIF